MKVAFVASLDGGGRLRAQWPAEGLAARGWDVEVSGARWVNGRAEGRWPSDLPAGSVVILHRPMSQASLQWVEAYRTAGCHVLVDEDDDMSCVPPENQHQPTPEMLRTHDAAIRAADGLIVTTPRLQEVYGPMARRSWVVPNLLASWVYDVRPTIIRRDMGIVRVGWAGTPTVHAHDLEWLRPGAERGFAGATLSLVGNEFSGKHLGWLGPMERFGWQDDPARFYALMARADIGMVPLDNGSNRAFNTAKSHLKSLEYAALGKPVVATRLPEQANIVIDGVTGFLAGDPHEFADRVRRLVTDPWLRERMGEAARRQAERWSIPAGIGRWEEILRAFSPSQRGREPQVRRGRPGRAVAPRSPVLDRSG